MTIAAITLTEPQVLHLIEKYLLARGIDPITVGIDGNLRFQVLDDTGAAVSLSGASIVATFTKGSTSVSLSTATLITGSTYEIKIDASQGSEVGDTGKGWYQLNYSSLAAFVTKLSPVQGRGTYKIDITFGDGTVRRHLRGEYDIL